MVKGIQRQMVMVRTTDSRFFETAYLVLRAEREGDATEGAIVDEANRIVSELCEEKNGKRRSREKGRRRKKGIVVFFCGFFIASILGAAAQILIALL